MTKHTFVIDSTQTTVVIRCKACPWWSALRFTRDEAWRVASDHERTHHPEQYHAQKMVSAHKRS